MAHADYDCCAICDCKLYYNAYDSRTKETICSDCLKALRDKGIHIITVEELINWIEKNPIEIVKETMKNLGFRECYYYNEVDELMREKGVKFDEKGYIKS